MYKIQSDLLFIKSLVPGYSVSKMNLHMKQMRSVLKNV